MSRARRGARVRALEMGEAINFEDVLTVMTVLLLLRLIFMVPLVNLDKAKTVSAETDAFWERHALWLHTHPGDTAGVAPYRMAFGIDRQSARHSLDQGIVWVESAAADSNLLVVRHDPSSGRYVAMHVQGPGHARSFRRGNLLWSGDEKEWFSASDSLDYGSRPESKAMEKEFRAWTRKHRGY